MDDEQCGENKNMHEWPIIVFNSNNCIIGEDRKESGVEPYVGLEFDTAEDAFGFYKLYAVNSGFTVRVGQLSRSTIDGSIISRKYVCSKEGFQRRFTAGCHAYIRVQKQDSGRWVIDRFQKNHTHDLECPQKFSSHDNAATCSSSLVSTLKKSVTESVDVKCPLKEANVQGRLLGVDNVENHMRGEDEGESKIEPCVGMEFDSAEEAQNFYNTYAHNSGFKIRSGQLTRSNIDGSVIVRRYVCSKEGFQHHSRVGCHALIRIKKQESGKWVLDRFQKDHNHSFEASEDEYSNLNFNLSTTPRPATDAQQSSGMLYPKMVQNAEEVCAGVSSGMPSPKIISNVEEAGAAVGSSYKDHKDCSKRNRRSSIGSDWYRVIMEYLRSKQAEDPGFFHAVEVDDGMCMSIFWADSRSRFSCSLFGDVVVFDTRYRTGSHVVPFASFIGVNHHKQPTLLGCALVADESKESFIWLFETWRMAMSGCRPLTIIADQDKVIRQAAAHVFPGIKFYLPMWHIKAKERENLGHVRAIHKTFKREYESCINKSRTASEFVAAWATLIYKYKLNENEWMKEMYEDRELWVPLYLRGTFFAGITTNGSENSFFGTLLSFRTPLNEFISRYERAIARRLEEEQKEDYVTMHKHVILRTKEPMEMQCEQLYTKNAFLRFQEELMECCNYAAKEIDEGTICRYLVHRHENEEEKYIVVFNCFKLDVTCSCQMFESEGFLCKHVLRVFQKLDITEIPSRYILRRWTKDCKYGTVSDVGSLRNYQECITSMVWSLREESLDFIKLGTMSLEQYDVAFSILQEGRRKLYSMRKRDDNHPSLEQNQKKQKV